MAKRIYSDAPDSVEPVPVITVAVGEKTGLTRKDGRLRTDPADAMRGDEAKSALELIAAKLDALVKIATTGGEVKAALDRVEGLLGLFRVERIIDMVAIPAPGANTDILSAAIDMTAWPGVKRLAVTVTLATASVLNYTKQRGITTSTIGMLESVALGAGDGFGPLTIPVGATDKINFRVETDSVITQLVVEGLYL